MHRDLLLKITRDIICEDKSRPVDSIVLNKGPGSMEVAGDDLLAIRVDADLVATFKWSKGDDKKTLRADEKDIDMDRVKTRALAAVRVGA